MNTEAKKMIERELCECSRNGKVDECETLAVLDAILNIWNKVTGEKRGEDIYEKVVLSMSDYDQIGSCDKEDISSFYAIFPKELIKGFKMAGKDEEILADLVALTVDKMVDCDYKSTKNITMPEKAHYRADMEMFEEGKIASIAMREQIEQRGGQEGLKILEAHLRELASKAIESQRRYFSCCVENMVNLHASIALEEKRQEADIQI